MIASLYVDGSIVHYAGKKGILVMGMSDGIMRVLNPEIVGSST